ncbi:hypothetical protein QBD01_003178 [Ochrobactrum sp. 19YEA23]|uniref:hypothetical protein n=1 Tax=Ochrobactrum sp. 19YEA23 TaxID=3039854 RepID=UPI00247ADB2B|nr:hypothetical protein [Ochrobactrum sp. 19YEA23]
MVAVFVSFVRGDVSVMQPVGVIFAPSGEVLIDDRQLAPKALSEKFRHENSDGEIRFN